MFHKGDVVCFYTPLLDEPFSIKLHVTLLHSHCILSGHLRLSHMFYTFFVNEYFLVPCVKITNSVLLNLLHICFNRVLDSQQQTKWDKGIHFVGKTLSSKFLYSSMVCHTHAYLDIIVNTPLMLVHKLKYTLIHIHFRVATTITRYPYYKGCTKSKR